MEMVQVELPGPLARAAKLNGADPSGDAARLLALELFRERKVSLSRAAELSQTALAAFMEFAAAHGASPVHYGADEWEEDRRTLAELGL